MMNKRDLLSEYRTHINEKYIELPNELNYKDKAKVINQYVQEYTKAKIEAIDTNQSKTEILSDVMMLSYVGYIVMLEYRNKAWPYEYMAFSRRIGEIWEPFCKLPFYYPTKELELIEPLQFEDVQESLSSEYESFTSSLGIDRTQKSRLLMYYDKIWKLVDSGNINLSLDLHFRQNEIIYNVDYKSGFGSNEKGNTNRLLQVGSIYSSLNNENVQYKNLIFVRQPEDENNHYLQTLKNSPYWDVFCSNDAYEKIKEFTGFDIKAWMDNNMAWNQDISDELRTHLIENELIDYLSW